MKKPEAIDFLFRFGASKTRDLARVGIDRDLTAKAGPELAMGMAFSRPTGHA